MSLRKLYMDCANFKGMQRQRQTMLHGFFSGQGLFHRRAAHGSGIIRQGQRRAGAGAPALVQAQNQAGAIFGFLHGLQHDIGRVYAELAVLILCVLGILWADKEFKVFSVLKKRAK